METTMDAAAFTNAAGFSPVELAVMIVTLLVGIMFATGTVAIAIGAVSSWLSGFKVTRLVMIAALVLLIIGVMTAIIS